MNSTDSTKLKTLLQLIEENPQFALAFEQGFSKVKLDNLICSLSQKPQDS